MASAGHSLARMSIGGSPELPTITEDIPLCLAAVRVSALTALWVRGCFQHLLSKITSLWGAPCLCCLAISSWSCRPPLIFLSVPSGLARGWSTVHGTHTARASICPAILPKSKGFWCVLRCLGRGPVLGGLGAPGACRHRAAIPAFPVGDAGGAQFSPQPQLCNARVHRTFSLAWGPSLPGPTPSPSPGTTGRRGKGRPWHGFVSAQARCPGCSGTSGHW